MRSIRHALVACFIVVAAAGGYVYWQAHKVHPVPAVATVANHYRKPPPPQLPKMALSPSTPTTLRIDKLKINAPIEGVGINKDGEMVDPRTATDATWYRYGYLPGALGNAVLAGHYLYESKPALFYRLHELMPGDEVVISTDQQNNIAFRVTDSQHYNADTAPFAEIFGASKTSQLRLVTCYGAWDKARQRYVERLVVTAEFVKETASSSAVH